jgi:hypothetical protein
VICFAIILSPTRDNSSNAKRPMDGYVFDICGRGNDRRHQPKALGKRRVVRTYPCEFVCRFNLARGEMSICDSEVVSSCERPRHEAKIAGAQAGCERARPAGDQGPAQTHRAPGNGPAACRQQKLIAEQEPEFDGRSCMAMTTVMTTGPVNEGPITMGTISAKSRIVKADSTREREGMDVETVATNPLLASDRKWGIRFSANGLTTVVVGMRYFGDARLSGYFAARVAARLGVHFDRIRLYYSATLPAVLQTPRLYPDLSSGGNFAPVAAAATALIEGMCDRVTSTAEAVLPRSELRSGNIIAMLLGTPQK